MSYNRNISKDFLETQYLTLKKSTRAIAEEFNLDRGTIKRHLRKNNIAVRSVSQAKKGHSRSLTAIQKQIFTLKCLYQDPNHVTQLARASGSDNPNFKHGRYIKNICSECQKEISPQALKCSSCASKKRNIGKIFKNSGWMGKGSYYKNIWMRSTWEVAYAKYLDKNSITWKYEPECFYLIENRSYRPDFLINNDTYVEIKGWMTETAQKKINEFQKQYPSKTLIVLRKKDLEELKVF